MTSLTLTSEQQSAVSTITNWRLHSSTPLFKLGGYAGTGKTTVIRALTEALAMDNISLAITAFTGKAVNVLQRKGLHQAETLHSLMYDVQEFKGSIEFERKDVLISRPQLIIVDEASMISTELYDDLMSFGVKVLFVGDPGQLEPVGDNPNLMAKPDLILQQIHRQAAESPIIRVANAVRNGAILHPRMSEGALSIKTKAGWRIPDAAQFDQIICAKNKTRTELNSKFRLFLNKPKNAICPEDKLIVLRNNRQLGVYNGMLIYVEEIKKETDLYWLASCKDEIDRKYPNLPIWKQPYLSYVTADTEIPFAFSGLPSRNEHPPKCVYTDFGYAITCHKSQGSEWDKVLVWNERLGWDMKRWQYTAITRAAKELTVCL